MASSASASRIPARSSVPIPLSSPWSTSASVRMVANMVEKDMKLVPVGTHAAVEVDAFPGEKFAGRVSRVAPVFDPATRTAEMEIEIPNSSYRLKPGMYSRVSLTVDSKRECADDSAQRAGGNRRQDGRLHRQFRRRRAAVRASRARPLLVRRRPSAPARRALARLRVVRQAAPGRVSHRAPPASRPSSCPSRPVSGTASTSRSRPG